MEIYKKYASIRSIQDMKKLSNENFHNKEALCYQEIDMMCIQAKAMMDLCKDIQDLKDKYVENCTFDENNGDINNAADYFKTVMIQAILEAIEADDLSSFSLSWEHQEFTDHLYDMIKDTTPCNQ